MSYPFWKRHRSRLHKRPKLVQTDEAVSWHFPEAQSLPWREAREFVLPCGQRYGVLWGSLQKAIQSYLIGMDRGDFYAANHAASMIHRIREDLGITDSGWPVIYKEYEEQPDDEVLF